MNGHLNGDSEQPMAKDSLVNSNGGDQDTMIVDQGIASSPKMRKDKIEQENGVENAKNQKQSKSLRNVKVGSLVDSKEPKVVLSGRCNDAVMSALDSMMSLVPVHDSHVGGEEVDEGWSCQPILYDENNFLADAAFLKSYYDTNKHAKRKRGMKDILAEQDYFFSHRDWKPVKDWNKSKDSAGATLDPQKVKKTLLRVTDTTRTDLRVVTDDQYTALLKHRMNEKTMYGAAARGASEPIAQNKGFIEAIADFSGPPMVRKSKSKKKKKLKKIKLQLKRADDSPSRGSDFESLPRKKKMKLAKKEDGETPALADGSDSELIPLDKKSKKQLLKEERRREKEMAKAAERDEKLRELAEKKAVKMKELKDKESTEKARRVWLSIARRDIPRAHKLFTKHVSVKQRWARDYSSQCERQVKQRALVLIPTQRDLTTKSRKLAKEMLMFWKKHERQIMHEKKKREKEVMEQRKKEEEMREAKRQQRKLNFLLTQTELYSHFIGAKMTTVKDSGGGGGVQEDPGPSMAPVDPENDPTAGLNADSDEDEEAFQRRAQEKAEEFLKMDKERMSEFDSAFNADRKRAAQAQHTKREMLGDEGGNQEQFDKDNDLTNPALMPEKLDFQQPTMFRGDLKHYQLKGLNWLVNLYDQGINGILADEMGLGKTIQSIAFVTHLAEVNDIWGPFLIVAPKSTLHNWFNEFKQFCPQLKVVPYWGDNKQREVLRRSWMPKNLYTRDAEFHVCVTSYQIVLKDIKYFNRLRWQFMILDEAQAIKSSQSERWKTLLGFKCRNRLLLTGTPIQNSMAELWALLHFIMPTIFDSHEEFDSWFSKDIEKSAGGSGNLNEHQLKRLHMILKPFMLRRVKKDVECEMPPKYEKEIQCHLSRRQSKLYKGLKSQLDINELFNTALSSDDKQLKNLMNLVMQLRKVCNHPELFDRRLVLTPYQMRTPLPYDEYIPAAVTEEADGKKVQVKYLHAFNSSVNEIKLSIPRLIFRDGIDPEYSGCVDNTKAKLIRQMSIMNAADIHRNIFSGSETPKTTPTIGSKWNNASFLNLLNMSASEIECSFFGGLIEDWLVHCGLLEREIRILPSDRSTRRFSLRQVSIRSAVGRDVGGIDEVSLILPRLPGDIENYLIDHRPLIRDVSDEIIPNSVSPPVDYICSDRSFANTRKFLDHHAETKELLCAIRTTRHKVRRCDSVPISLQPPSSQCYTGMLGGVYDIYGGSQPFCVPHMSKMVAECGKLAELDRVLRERKEGGHRCLIFCQMTKMIDLLEEYLQWRKYSYLRLDGSSDIGERRDMMHEFQTGDSVFVFILSTRAGGVGINLTAADTVIFYDNDWNPTADAQAMDRAHRIGQKRAVTVYRLVTKSTVEERILKRATQKHNIQQTVYSGNLEFQQENELSRNEVLDMLLDEDEARERVRQQEAEKQKGRKRKLESEEDEMERQAAKAKKDEERRLLKEQKEREREEKRQKKLEEKLQKTKAAAAKAAPKPPKPRAPRAPKPPVLDADGNPVKLPPGKRGRPPKSASVASTPNASSAGGSPPTTPKIGSPNASAAPSPSPPAEAIVDATWPGDSGGEPGPTAMEE